MTTKYSLLQSPSGPAVSIPTGDVLVSNGDGTFSAAELPSGSSTLFDAGNSGAAITLDYTVHSKFQKVTLTANAVNIAITPGEIGVYLLEVLQDATGGRIPTFIGVEWPGGVQPTFSTAANAKDIASFFWDGTTINGLANMSFA